MPIFIIIVVISMAPIVIFFYCLLNWPVRTIIISALLLTIGAVRECSASNTITAESEGIDWIVPEGVMGYPYKTAKIRVTNQSGGFFSRFEIECDTQSGSVSFYDYAGISANATAVRTYKLDNSGISELTNCSTISVEKGKPNSGYNPNNWSYGEMPE